MLCARAKREDKDPDPADRISQSRLIGDWGPACCLQVITPLLGKHNVYNVLAAVAVGISLNINLQVHPPPPPPCSRSQLLGSCPCALFKPQRLASFAMFHPLFAGPCTSFALFLGFSGNRVESI